MNLYRVNYKYVSNAGALRQGAIVVLADANEQAEELALEKVPTTHNYAQITSSEIYQQQLKLPAKPKK